MPPTNITAAAASTTLSLSNPQSSNEEDLDIYDEIEIEDMTYDSKLQIYHYPCPCGDRFEVSVDSLRDGEDVAVCPSCSLMVRVIYELEDLPAAEKKEGKGRAKEGKAG